MNKNHFISINNFIPKNIVDSFSKKFIDCSIHGKGVEALLNGQCLECRDVLRMTNLTNDLTKNKRKIKLDCGIPLRFIDSSFSNYLPTNQKSNDLHNFIKSFKCDSNLIMLGKTGTGKTHLACALLNDIIEVTNWSVRYVQFYKITDIKIHNPDDFFKLLSCNLLVIDEYGVQSSDFKSNLLFEIINERYNNMLFTVIISNLDVKYFAESISAPLASRLKENSIFKTCDWTDYRLGAAK